MQTPFAPPLAHPPMTYDEASMQGSRHFYNALQELKSLQPQLYSAAEYCESSYLFNDQKQVVLENLKDYAVKALVNAVDHLGTVAYKLDEVLTQQIGEISSVEIRVAGLAQRVNSCQEYKSQEVLSHQRPARVDRKYHKHYVLPDAVSNNEQSREKTDERVLDEQQASQSDSGETAKTLSWHLSAESPAIEKIAHEIKENANRVPSPSSASESPKSDNISIAPADLPGSSSGQIVSTASMIYAEYQIHDQISTLNVPKSPVSRAPPSRSKSLLSSLLGRKRSGKYKSQA